MPGEIDCDRTLGRQIKRALRDRSTQHQPIKMESRQRSATELRASAHREVVAIEFHRVDPGEPVVIEQ